MGKMLDKFKENMNKEGNQKKKLENLVFFLVLLIIVVIAINFIIGSNEDETENINMNKQFVANPKSNIDLATTKSVSSNLSEEELLQVNLENILSNINGAGNVKAMITYIESSEVVAMYNESNNISTTEETDAEGGVRTIEQIDKSKEVVYTEESGTKVPVTEKVIKPKIEGAIILAEGANNASVKNNIVLAVEAVTGLSTHKIQVFELDKSN